MIGLFFFIMLILLFLFFSYNIAVHKSKNGKAVKIGDFIIFILTTTVLINSIASFINIARFVSETNIPITDITNGSFWNYMEFLNLIVIVIIWIASGVRLIKKKEI